MHVSKAFFPCVVAFSLCASLPAAGEDDPVSIGAWRTDCSTSGFAAVAGKVKVPADVRKSLWEEYRDHVGHERVQMGRPSLVATNEWGGVYDLPFATEAGASGHLGVFMGNDARYPLYWTSEADCANGDCLETALAVISAEGKNDVSVSTVSRTLDSGSATLRLDLSGKEVAAPFSRFRLFVSDDMPMADWRHPTRIVFVKEDGSSWVVLYADEPLSVFVSGVAMPLEACEPGLTKPKGTRSAKLSASSRPRLAGSATFSPVTDGDPSRCHALLISGGCNVANNHCRYWNEVCFVYNVLRQRYRLPRENIKVLWAGGDPSRDLCRCGTCTYTADGNPCGLFAFEENNLSDFDLDGNADINGAATLANVRAVLSSFEASLSEGDQLLVFCSDHGGTYGNRTGGRATVCLWGEDMRDSDLDAMTRGIRCPVMFALKTCYSGGMISEIVDNSKYRAVATADRYDPSLAHYMMGDWTYYFFSALCGYYPAGTPTSTATGLNPRALDGACNADTDGDGRVSFYEAHQFAYKMNPFPQSADIPQYEESTANLGKKLFMTKFADVPVVAVREKVLAPSLDPPSGALGYAPQTIRASCGTPGATIRYTTDGSAPTGKSSVYSGGIAIFDDTVVSIRAFKSGMDASDTVSVPYTVRKTAPQKAIIVSVSQGDSTGGIAVNWLKGDGATRYDILRGESSGMNGAIAVAGGLPASTTAFFDTDAYPGRTYYYQVVAANQYGSTPSAVSLAARRKLSPPSSVSDNVTADAVTSRVVLDWTAPPGATHFRVFREIEDGTRTEVSSGWQAATSVTDGVPMNQAYYRRVRYYLQSAASSSGAHPSDFGEPHVVNIDASVADKDISFSRPRGSVLAIQIQRATQALFWASAVQNGLASYFDSCMAPMSMQLTPGESRNVYCEIVDGAHSHYAYGTEITYSTSDSFTASIASGSGNISLSKSNNGYDLAITAKTSTSTKPAVIRTVLSSSTAKKSRDILVYVSSAKIIKDLDLNDLPRSLASGETVELSCLCSYMDGTSGALPSGTVVTWSIESGEGAEIDDDELIVHEIDAKTTITLVASVETSYGTVSATKVITLLPSMPTETVIVPALGGASSPVFVTRLPSPTEFRFPTDGWLNKISILCSDVKDVSSAWSYDIGAGGRKTLLLKDYYIWISFSADRNAGKDREQAFSFRWDGGGVNYIIRQAAAPVANAPNVSVGADGSISVGTTGDGSTIHYATDGEEPSAGSPILDGTIAFDDDTECAVKAFGDWMLPSDTIYEDVTGKNSKRDEITILFDPVQPKLVAPTSRTYGVGATFGALPSLPDTNGLYFKGWSLSADSERTVAANDTVPTVSATLYAVWSASVEDKPSVSVVPWDFEHSIYVIAMVYDLESGAFLTPDECSIVVEDLDGVCRGSTENGFGDFNSPLNGVDGLHVFGVYGSTAPERNLKVRVWAKGRGFLRVRELDATFPSYSWTKGTLGSADWPHFINVTPEPYSVHFNANAGDAGGNMETIVVERNTLDKIPRCAFSRVGHTFAGWSLDAQGEAEYADRDYIYNLAPSGGDAMLYAVWIPQTYTATFDANGGRGGQVVTVAYGAPLSAPAVAFDGHAFAGWQPAVPATMPAANVTYVAQWTKKDDPLPDPTYTVAFSANGGKLPKGKKMAAQKMVYGKAAKLTKNVFVRKGYVFAGWATSKADAKKGVIAFANAQSVKNLRADGKTTTLYAVWAKPTYKVAFYANGGTGKTVVQTFKYGKAAKLKANKFKAPKGKKFAGWATSKANAKKGKVAYKNKQKVKNLVITGKTVKLYAVWKKK